MSLTTIDTDNYAEMAKAMGYESQAIISQIEKGHREITGVASKCLEYLEIVMNKK